MFRIDTNASLPMDKLSLEDISEDGLSTSKSKGKMYVVLVSTGSFNPPTYMHLRCFEHRIAMCNLSCRSYDFVMVDSWENNVIVVDEVVPNGISSTRLRDCISRGLSLKYLIADEVIHYITQNGLYVKQNRDNPTNETAPLDLQIYI